MSFGNKVATIFGGTGFLGRQVVRGLARQGVTVKVATRSPDKAYFLKPSGTVGQVVPVFCDYNDEAAIARLITESDYVVNCVGILYEKKKGQFQRAHIDLPAAIAKACAASKVKRFVHVSALGIDKATSRYAQTKLEGEKFVKLHFPAATILRPSIMFGEDDQFFNKFAMLARLFPALPLIGGGKTKFQPVFVGDVANAVLAALVREDAQGQTYELGGPETLTFKEIYLRLFQYTGRRRKLVALPWGIAKMKAAFLSLTPKPLLTPDQVESLKTDSIVAPGAKGLADLGVEQTAPELVLPRYLERHRSGGRFASAKAA